MAVTFLIADTFSDSLARLSNDEQKAVKTTAFDLQMDASAPGLSFHKLDKAKDKRFWSVRVNSDIRLIVHRTDASLLLCYVDHHDSAYAWAERRKLETHPATGAAQIIELREWVRKVGVPAYVPAMTEHQHTQTSAPKQEALPLLFQGVSDQQLLGLGVPPEWMEDVREATEDSLLSLADRLPAEAAEALLELATGGHPSPRPQPQPEGDPFAHPDAQRRFRVMNSVEELERALDSPWEKWVVFLHPEQRQLVERGYSGPARVSGSAGTGKTVVALHRAVFLTRSNPDARVLLTTFSDALAHALRSKLRRLVGDKPRLMERLEVHALPTFGRRLYQSQGGKKRLVTREETSELLREAAAAITEQRFSPAFLRSEWDHVVDAWQLATWEAYRDVSRLGRRTRLPEAQRAVLWEVFEHVRAGLAQRGLVTEAGLFQTLATAIRDRPHVPFDFVVVDEAQDIGITQLRFLAALGRDRPNALFFAGDMGQRIFQQPFSWRSQGVDIRGRSRALRVNYRTSHQIRAQADRLLGAELTDVDGNREDRRHTVSVFNGPAPEVQVHPNARGEEGAAGAWLADRIADGLHPQEVGIFVRSSEQIPRAVAAVTAARLAACILDERVDVRPGQVSVGTMHLAKGLEFRAVAVMACDDDILPLQSRIATVGDDGDLQEVYDTERQLLYVACTRARDHLMVTGVDPASEFLDDLKGA